MLITMSKVVGKVILTLLAYHAATDISSASIVHNKDVVILLRGVGEKRAIVVLGYSGVLFSISSFRSSLSSATET